MKQGKYREYPTLAQDQIREEATKHCGKCDTTKGVTEFGTRTKTTTGLSTWCIECNRAYDRQYRARFRPRKLNEWYRRVYGIAYRVFRKILTTQHGLCSICHVQMDEPHLDHCPVEGKIRGILCHKCNCGLGMFIEDPTLLRRAADYLERGI